MHLYFMTRGIKKEVDHFVNDMSAQYFPYKMGGKMYHTQLAMRPIQLWEVVFPETAMNEVLKTTFTTNPVDRKEFGLGLGMVRKMLKVEPVPKFDENAMGRIVNKNFVAIYPIGIKRDEKHKGEPAKFNNGIEKWEGDENL